MDYADMELMRTVIMVAMVALVAILPRETAVQYHAHNLLLLRELSCSNIPHMSAQPETYLPRRQGPDKLMRHNLIGS